jgi:AcrR family transcriptional regulator
VVEAALRVVDAEGVDALTMRRLADELEVGVMTLYGYVRSKEELLDALVERVLGDIEVAPVDGGDWKQHAAAQCHAFRRSLLEHPGVAHIFLLQAVSSPSAFRASERLLTVLRDAGFDDRRAVAAYTALLTYTLGSSLWEIPRSSTRDRTAAEAQRLARLRALPPGEFPSTTKLAAHLVSRADEELFAYGLDRMLAGIQAG